MRVGTEFRWILDGYTPDTIPMSRLAEYMLQLAKLFGEEAAVHFDRVERGSVALVSRIDGPSVGRVSARISALKHGPAQADVLKTYNTMNTMLAEDKGTAVLREGSVIVVRFPGRQNARRPLLSVPDTGSVVGYLYMLIDAGQEYHARIRLESGSALQCTVSGPMAKRLRDHLFETVKVHGTGIWARGRDGNWAVASLAINDVVRADSAQLRAVVEELRKLPIEWPDDPLALVDELNQEEGNATQ